MNKSVPAVVVLFACSILVAGDFETTKKAAEQGDAEAQYNLGVMYANGDGLPEDDAEAVRWYRMAAEQGIRRGTVQSWCHVR